MTAHDNRDRFVHLFVYDDPSPAGGGIQNMAYWIPISLREKGFRVVVAGRRDYLVAGHFDQTGVEFFPYQYPFRTSRTSDIRLLCLLLRLRFRYGRNVILYSMVINNVKVIRWLGRLLPWHVVSFLHGNETLRLLSRRPETLRRNLLACRAVFANSEYARGLVERLQPFGNVHVVHPGLPTVRYQDPPGTSLRKTNGWEGRKIILMLSRLVSRKGHGTVIRAVSRIRPRHPEVLLLIAGTGGHEGEIRKLAEEAGIQGNIQLLGFVREEDKPALYAACDVFCMPSEASEQAYDVEGFGITFIEAAAMGKIAIGARAGGMGDAIEDGSTGFLIEPGDADGLADLLDKIFSHPESYDAIRRRARERALTLFDWSNQTEKIIDLLAEEIGK
ncbi:MAG: glycosyltransferase family 4 protein [Nitrospirae bacterium]|nr:glycosyltransferase family 4 protein [Nitrospirota bacterium]